jgi:hypothetical protein
MARAKPLLCWRGRNEPTSECFWLLLRLCCWPMSEHQHFASKPLQVGLLLLCLNSSTYIGNVAKQFPMALYVHLDVCEGRAGCLNGRWLRALVTGRPRWELVCFEASAVPTTAKRFVAPLSRCGAVVCVQRFAKSHHISQPVQLVVWCSALHCCVAIHDGSKLHFLTGHQVGRYSKCRYTQPSAHPIMGRAEPSAHAAA